MPKLRFLPLLLAAFLGAQEPGQEEEAPAALFEIPLGDSRVDLFLEGSWTVRATAGLGFGWDEVGIREALSLAEITRGLIFSQEPDLHFRVLIDERWLSELHYSSGSLGNTFLLGYRGRDTEALRYVSLGTTPLTIPARAGLAPQPNRPGTAAFSLGAGSPDATFDFLTQYESRQEEKAFFRGRREVITIDAPASSWSGKRYFRLPGSAFSGLRFLAGNGGSWRDAAGGEVIADPQTGLVEIPVLREQTYLARWDGFAAGNDPVTGLPHPTVTIGSDDWLVLADGPAYSGLELKNRYPLPEQWRDDGFDLQTVLTRRGSDIGLPSGISVYVDPAARVAIVEGSSAPGPDYPFFDAIPGLYAPGGETREGAQHWGLRFLLLRREEGFRLGTGIQSGSVRAFRNGVPYHAFSFDAATGLVSISESVFPNDAWEFRFLQQTPDSGANRLFVWQGNTWNLSPSSSIETMAGLQWTIDDDVVTRLPEEAPGALLARFLYKGSEGPWSWEVEAGGRADVPDATGRRVWEDFSGGPETLALNGSVLRPSALPPQNPAWGTDNPGNILALTSGNRGRLRYRDYFSRDVFGNTFLRPFGAAGVEPSAYQTGAPVGPYIAQGGNGSELNAAVMEYELTSARRWVGAQFFLAEGGTRDLSGARVLRLTHRLETGSPNLRLFLVAGTLGEDPDGTSNIRSRVYQPLEGLPWTDSVDGFGLVFPTPGASPPSTAWQGRNYYQTASVTYAVSKELPLPGTVWSTVTVPLTEAEAKLLASSNSLQLVLVSTVAADLAGVYQVQNLQWEGASASAQAISPSVTPPRVWETSGVLRAESGDGPWELTQPVEPLRLQDYRRLTFRLRVPSGPSPTPLNLRLADADGRGLNATFNIVPGPAWQNTELNLESGEVLLNGSSAGTLSWDRSSLEIRTARLAYSGTAAIELEWDDLEARDSLIQWSGDARGLLRWEGDAQNIEAEVRGSRENGNARAQWSGTLGPLAGKAESTFGWFPEARWQNQYDFSWNQTMVTAGERYSDLGSRSQKLETAIPWFGKTDAAMELQWNAWSADQKFTLKHSDFLEELFDGSFKTSLSLTLTQTARDGLSESGTLALWPASLLRMWAADPDLLLSRTWNAGARLDGKWDFWKVWAELKAVSSSSTTENGTLMREWHPALGLSWTPDPTERTWTFTLEAKRTSSAVASNLPIPTLMESWRQEPMLWSASFFRSMSPPFSEWFLASSEFWAEEPLGQRSRVWGQTSLGLSRPPLLNRWDFWLPAGLNLSWETAQEYSGAFLRPEPKGSALLRWQALNQFGSFASEPLFDFYTQDEFSTLARVDYRHLRTDVQPVFDLSVLQTAAFYQENFTVRLDQTVLYQAAALSSWTWKGKAVLTWDFPIDFPLQIPYMRSPADFQERWVTTLTAETWWGTLAQHSGWGFRKILLEPKAEWFFHPFGVISLTGSTGLEILDGVNVTGAQIGLELRVKF